MLIRLLRWKIVLLKRSLVRSTAAIVGAVIVTPFAVAWFFSLFFGSCFLFTAAAALPEFTADAGALLQVEMELLASAYTATLAVGLLVGIRGAFLSMYASSDLPLLFSAPLKVTRVFLLKFIELAGSTALCTGLVALPVALAYGMAMGAGLLYYLLSLLLLVLVSVFIAAVSALINLLVMRILPPYRIKELGAVLGALLGGLLYSLAQVAPRSVIGSTPREFIAAISNFSLSQVPLSPAWWMARANAAAVGGATETFFFWGALTAFVSIGFLCLSFFLVQKAFYGGWAGSGEVRRKRKARGRKPIRLEHPLIKNTPTAAIAFKELHTVLRNPGEWAQAVYMLIILTVPFAFLYVSSFGNLPAEEMAEVSGELSRISPYLLLGWGYLLIGVQAMTLVLGAVAREGRGWFLLRGFPITVKQILWGKFWAHLPMVCLPAALLALLANLLFEGSILNILILWAFLLILAPAAVAINLGLGSISPDFTAEDIRKRVSPGETLLSPFLGLAYALPTIIGIVMIFAGSWAGWGGILLRLGGVAVLVGVSAATVLISINAASASLENSHKS